MNKKMILSIIGIALLAFVSFGLFKANDLKTIRIEKSILIKAPQEKVFDMVKYLKNFPKWSPFLAQDPGQKYEIKGTDGTIGAQYHWDGNGGKDIGFQEIVSITDQQFVGMKCDIQKPFVAKPTFDYYFSQTAEGVLVKQDFKLESGTIDAFFMWLFGAKSEMEKTNQQGLELLKKAAELQ